MIRFGRYISIPDIEAQLAPNNYMYTHSMTYTFDNYTNTGIETTLAVTKNWIFQLGVIGRHRGDALACRRDDRQSVPEPALSGAHHAEGSRRDSEHHRRRPLDQRRGNDDINLVADGINGGQWGYNNLQWYGLHLLSQVQRSVAHLVRNLQRAPEQRAQRAQSRGAGAFLAAGGTPFSPQYMPFNAPGLRAVRQAPTVLSLHGGVPDRSDVSELQAEPAGQHLVPRGISSTTWRVSAPAPRPRYVETGIGWQHWFSPQIEIRPEVSYYKSLDALRLQRQFEPRHCRQPRTTPSSARRTSSFTSDAWKGVAA